MYFGRERTLTRQNSWCSSLQDKNKPKKRRRGIKHKAKTLVHNRSQFFCVYIFAILLLEKPTSIILLVSQKFFNLWLIWHNKNGCVTGWGHKTILYLSRLFFRIKRDAENLALEKEYIIISFSLKELFALSVCVVYWVEIWESFKYSSWITRVDLLARLEMEVQKRSAIWLHFGTISNEKAKRNICKNIYSYKNGSVTNLRNHLKNKHPTMMKQEQGGELCNRKIEILNMNHQIKHNLVSTYLNIKYYMY